MPQDYQLFFHFNASLDGNQNLWTWSASRKRWWVPSNTRTFTTKLGSVNVVVVHGNSLPGRGHPRNIYNQKSWKIEILNDFKLVKPTLNDTWSGLELYTFRESLLSKLQDWKKCFCNFIRNPNILKWNLRLKKNFLHCRKWFQNFNLKFLVYKKYSLFSLSQKKSSTFFEL